MAAAARPAGPRSPLLFPRRSLPPVATPRIRPVRLPNPREDSGHAETEIAPRAHALRAAYPFRVACRRTAPAQNENFAAPAKRPCYRCFDCAPLLTLAFSLYTLSFVSLL